MKEVSDRKVWAGFVGMLVIGFTIALVMRWLGLSLDWYLQACAAIIVALVGVYVVIVSLDVGTQLRKRMGLT